jgi:hypothetical protein
LLPKEERARNNRQQVIEAMSQSEVCEKMVVFTMEFKKVSNVTEIEAAMP